MNSIVFAFFSSRYFGLNPDLGSVIKRTLVDLCLVEIEIEIERFISIVKSNKYTIHDEYCDWSIDEHESMTCLVAQNLPDDAIVFCDEFFHPNRSMYYISYTNNIKKCVGYKQNFFWSYLSYKIECVEIFCSFYGTNNYKALHNELEALINKMPEKYSFYD